MTNRAEVAATKETRALAIKFECCRKFCTAAQGKGKHLREFYYQCRSQVPCRKSFTCTTCVVSRVPQTCLAHNTKDQFMVSALDRQLAPEHIGNDSAVLSCKLRHRGVRFIQILPTAHIKSLTDLSLSACSGSIALRELSGIMLANPSVLACSGSEQQRSMACQLLRSVSMATGTGRCKLEHNSACAQALQTFHFGLPTGLVPTAAHAQLGGVPGQPLKHDTYSIQQIVKLTFYFRYVSWRGKRCAKLRNKASCQAPSCSCACFVVQCTSMAWLLRAAYMQIEG